MLKRKLGLLVAAAVMVGMFTSCLNVNVNKEKENTPQGNGIDYTNYTGSDYSIKVRNESSKNVVCFKGAPVAGCTNLISGAVAQSGITGLKMNNTLFKTTEDFVLWVFTEDDYKAKKNDIDELKKTPFALIYAIYNADSDSNANMVYTISSKMGGESYIILNNPTNYNVELRQNGLYGESLAFAGANTVQTRVNVAFDDYYIYPVFRKFHKKSGEIVTCFPKEKNIDKPVYFEFSLSEGEGGQKSQEFNVGEWFDPNAFKDTTTPAAAYITITNGNKKTGISLYKGASSEAEVTSTGGKKINTGKTLVFEIPMTSTGNRTYSSTAKISGWKVGASVERGDVPEITVDAGKMYYLDVGGENAYEFPAVWRTTKNEANEDVVVADPVSYDEE
jgi:hypothetical protein